MARNKFDVDENLEVQFNFGHLKRMMGYVKPYKKEMIITLVLMIIANAAGLLSPYLMKEAIDSKIPQSDKMGLVVLSLIILATLVISGVCMKFRIRTMARVGQCVLENIRRDLFVHLQKLPFTYYDSRPHGKILVRVVNYVNSLSDLLSNGLINLITDFISLFIALGFMLAINVKLTLISMIGIPVLFAVILALKNVQRKAFQALSNKQSNMNAYIHESITGIKVTQSFAREDKNLDIFREVSGEYRSSWMKAVAIQFLIWPSVENISTLTIALVYIAGVYSLDKTITVGVLVAFIGYIGRFWMPIINIGNFYNAIITAMSYLERIFETLDEVPEVADMPGAVEMPEIKGDVEFKDVHFKYDDDKEILKGINQRIKAGSTIALVGPTGAGKTTVINLLSRFYDVSSGEVYIDGIDVREVTLSSLRKQMGVMLQDTFLFSGTVLDNIRYGKLDATDEEVIAAAKAVRAHEFIMELPQGYNTEVNERGTRLSVGQRQLISFARALLADPKILILDEATSSIDTKTEITLQKGLETLLKGRTSFIIAHRLSTIKNADKILYIKDGIITEEGSHEELMAKGGDYNHLYNSQFIMLKAV
ncbi:ATP-binding cassette, subfamily B [Clostridium amylolyticum]|uniref:ATP-binding cassette, subfamily B n=1 Tax=Clostridium amylolyticum TaxID=1121298 RepID=A0A1M6EEC7_9CLOT|nr:ABC transporter ATP-binding protein [Clostridium amylolyticum]SHI83658.1 ATP-binding cassette, subfamily B [Clostridium amylolyticum]